MPVRSLNSRVLKWPDRKSVLGSFTAWASSQFQIPNVINIGTFGSIHTDKWGVGSDLDIVVLLKEAESDFFHRGVEFDTTSIPVPVDLLVYTVEEWSRVETAFRRQVRWHSTTTERTVNT